MSTAPPAPDTLTGRTVHVTRGATYQGAYTISEILETTDTGVQWKGAWHSKTGPVSNVTFSALFTELHDSETGAREAARARRQPRRQQTVVPSTGDWAFIAAVNGLDRFGRRGVR